MKRLRKHTLVPCRELAVPCRVSVSRGRQRQAGATLVEFAFILILFLSFIFGISGLGHALFTYHHINNIAKESTRYAAVRGFQCNVDETVSSCQAGNSASGTAGPTTLTDIQAFARSITPQSIDASAMTITACGVSGQSACTESAPQICSIAVGGAGPTPNYPGCTAKVTVQYSYNLIFPLIQTSPINMSSTSEMIIIH